MKKYYKADVASEIKNDITAYLIINDATPVSPNIAVSYWISDLSGQPTAIYSGAWEEDLDSNYLHHGIGGIQKYPHKILKEITEKEFFTALGAP